MRLTMERTTQTETRVPRWRQLLYCLAGDDRYRRRRQFEAGRLLIYWVNHETHQEIETRVPRLRQLLYCFAGDDRYRRPEAIGSFW